MDEPEILYESDTDTVELDDDYFFEHPSEKMSAVESDKLWHMYNHVKEFCEDNYLPTVKFTDFNSWMVHTDEGSMSLETLHSKLAMFNIYDKTVSELTHFILWNVLSSVRTKPR